MFQHATHTIVVLDTAWPCASEAYGLCRLAHTFVRINLYAQDERLRAVLFALRINLYAQDHTLLFPK